jgi:hypothetical protein
MTTLGVDGSVREKYLAALIKAVNANEYVDLIGFARR